MAPIIKQVSASEWDQFIGAHPEANLLQTRPWGELKSSFGWQAAWVIQGECGSQVLFKKLPLGFTFAYIPKGPVGPCSGWRSLWKAIDRICRQQRAVSLKVEPDLYEPADPDLLGSLPGFFPSDPIQPYRTILVDLEGGPDQWLERMKQKTRYNIRLAERKGVTVTPSSDLDQFYGLMQSTGERDAFAIHDREYYRRAFELFHPRGKCELFIAQYEGKWLAGLMAFAQGKRAWYLFGASTEEERSRMPTYLLQWEAMRWAASHGCVEYDLVGVPDEEEKALEDQFASRSDGLWGVYRFKRGFGGRLARSVGAFDRPYVPFAGYLYRYWRKRRQRIE